MDRADAQTDGRPPWVNSKMRLAAPTEAHYRAIYPLRYEPEVMRWADDMPNPPELEEFLQRRKMRRADPTCIERVILCGRRPVGTVTAFGINRFSRDCELGIVIVDRRAWGHGVGPRAMRLFFRVLRRTGIEVVHLETFVDNVRARAAFEKVGFEARETYFDRDIGREVVVMRIALDEEVSSSRT